MPPIDRQATFSGTREVADALRLDPGRLAAYLAQHLPDAAGPLTVRQFKGGQSNPTYLIQTPTRRLVLRRKPPGKLLPSAHAVDREYRVLQALARQQFPVARPRFYCADETVIGTPFYVMDFVDGRVFWDPGMPGPHPPERTAVYDAMNATLARLHGFDPAAIGLADFGRGESYVARQVERWSKQYRASQTEVVESMERLIAWLPAHLPPPAPVRLVHGDYRLDNLIVAPSLPSPAAPPPYPPPQAGEGKGGGEGGKERGQVLAVLDWELSTLGDPLADFAYHLMQWDMPPSESGYGVGTLVGLDLAAIGIPSRTAYVDAYVARTGLDPRPHLAVYLAYNFFRLAAILQGIVGRVRDGTAANENAAAMALMVRPLADKGWGFVQGNTSG
ncbi:MAG: phosphotransferase [Rhizobiales bacterium]|nr:phosphotransferase [Hyphomicrobiales bacterium]